MVIKNIVINPEQTIKESMRFINLNGFRSLIVVDKKNIVLGILTDGDIRRAISKGMDIKESINNIYEKKISYGIIIFAFFTNTTYNTYYLKLNL